jgi:hypothetical protein
VPQRTELAVTDGWPPPADLPRGELILWPTGNGDEFTIGRADPRILISAELIEAIVFGYAPMAVLCAPPRHRPPSAEQGRPTFTGALIKIYGVNRTVIYQITEYLPRVNGYIGQWPD